MKIKKIILMSFMLSFAFLFGHILSETLCYFIFPRKNHVCTCEYCKLTRQIEAIEVVDSVISDRIIIHAIKEDEK